MAEQTQTRWDWFPASPPGIPWCLLRDPWMGVSIVLHEGVWASVISAFAILAAFGIMPAPAVEALVEGTAVAGVEVGDDEAGIGAVAASLDPGDDAADPAPKVQTSGCSINSLKRRTLPALGSALKRAAVARLEADDVALQRAGQPLACGCFSELYWRQSLKAPPAFLIAQATS